MVPALILAALVALIPGAVPRSENGRIAFVTNETIAPRGLVSTAATGGVQILLHADPSEARTVVPSPDGSRIAYDIGPTNTVYVARADGKGRTKIAAGFSPAWAPDGARVVFVGRDGKLGIAEADGKTSRTLGVPGRDPAWSPTGDWIAFSGSPNRVEVIRPDGTGRRTVADNATGSPVLWSASGVWVAFGSTSGSTSQIHVARLDGSGRRSIGEGAFGFGQDPVWAPTDDRLAFVDGDDLRILAADGDPLLTVSGVSGTPAWSPDGRSVAVGSHRVPLAVIDAATGANRRLGGRGVPRWSPEGSRLAYASNGSLWTIAAAGGAPRLVTRGVEGLPLWLRSGRLVYPRRHIERQLIVTTAPTGRNRRLLVSTPLRPQVSAELTELAWSPDGRRLAFVRDPERTGQLELIGPGGERSRVVARTASMPSWSPDGKSLTFVGRDGIHVVAASGGRGRALTRGAEDDKPAWSPDGSRIAFVRGSGLFVIGAGGSGLRRLASDVSTFSWSPDARRIVYGAGDADGGTAIAIVGADGKGRRYLAREDPPEETGTVIFDPRWSPDGRSILHHVEEYLCGSKCTELFLAVIAPSGGSYLNVTTEYGDYLSDAVWSPDGKRLLGHDPDGALFSLDIARDTKRRIARSAGPASWQPLPRR